MPQGRGELVSSRSSVTPPSHHARRTSVTPVQREDSAASFPADLGAVKSIAALSGALKFKGLLNMRLRARRARLGDSRVFGQVDCTSSDEDLAEMRSGSAGIQDYGSTEQGLLSEENRQRHEGSGKLCTAEKTPQTDIAAVRELVFGNKVCVFLLCIPFGTLAAFLNWSEDAVFVLNFFAILPLAQLLGDFTEEVALYTNDTIGGLLNATLGNATELIISIFAIEKNLLRVVQVSLLGSVLSNELLVTGCCFFFGGMYFKEQNFNAHIAAIDSSLLLMAVLGLTIPAAFSSTMSNDCRVPCKVPDIVTLSHFTALMLFFLYGMLLVFQLKTHTHLMDAAAEAYRGGGGEEGGGNSGSGGEEGAIASDQEGERQLQSLLSRETIIFESETHPEEATMTLRGSIVMLTITTLLVALCSELLVDSLEAVSKSWGLSEVFIGLILLPIIGNAAEHATAITVAMKGKMDLALGVALGSSVQIALCVVPALCLVGWILQKPLTLDFHPFETIVLVVSVLVVTSTVRQGTSTWLEGIMLIISYLIIALAYFFRKEVPAGSALPQPSCICGEACCFPEGLQDLVN